MWIAIAGIVLVLVLVLVAGASLAWGTRRWRKDSAHAVARLEGTSSAAPVARYDERETARLPAPVARYFRVALRPGQPMIVRAHVEHAGRFRGGAADAWRPFASIEAFAVSPPGFVWDARIRTAPAITVRVRDAYVAGEASMRAAVLGVVPLVDVRDRPDLAEGALLRYLAEAVWLPTALLPSQGVEWAAIDESSARATLRDGETTASLEFRFDRLGHVASTFAHARPRALGSTFEPTPWTCRYSTWVNRGGMQVPLEGEAAWKLPDRALAYWHGRLAKVEYTFAS
jgi:uncharacterized protein DUF6920